ncbi:MAG: inorganic phosphate transporter [Methanomicrobiales archaeon]|nr:inorganic phosphate transporter [Methanomicrobiales archaeon]
MLAVAILALAIAFIFTFTNGFQDSSAIAATFIASRSANPRQGILFTAGACFLGAVFGGSAVALTLAHLITTPSQDSLLVVLLSALLGATIWNIVTARSGLPSSSTHAIIGGLIGGGMAAGGTGSVFWGFAELAAPSHRLEGLMLILIFLWVSIFIGLAGGYLVHTFMKLAFRNARRNVTRTIVVANWIAAGVMAFANGSNDVQKQLGVIALILVAAGWLPVPDIPMTIRIVCALLLSLGALGGGWRIMHTLGHRIFKISPIHSLDSQISSGAAISFATIAGAPISSTHIISTSVIGVGAAENPKKMRWSVGKEVVTAMVITIPATLVLTAGIYLIIATLLGV